MSEAKLKIEDIVGESSFKTSDTGRINKVAVVGLGIMGRGIAQTISAAGIDVIALEISKERLAETLETLGIDLDREIQRWAMTKADKKSLLSRINGTISPDEIRDCGLLIEAVDENFESKKKVFQMFDQFCKPAAILVSNTSTLNLSKIAAVTTRQEKVIGMHFLNPVPKTPVVELVRGTKTSNDTFQLVKGFAERLGKVVIEVFDYPGFVTTRIIIPMLNEAMNVLMQGVSTAEGIEQAMKLGYNLPMGPLEMADTMGLDEVLAWMETLFNELGESKYRPSPFLQQLVREGKLGKKNGKGFFAYDNNGKRIH
ncbi:MAG: 3-hydroxyacyl-CoA dehydrogenase NAD-binding domain-containing protein [Bacteroidota bacterium]